MATSSPGPYVSRLLFLVNRNRVVLFPCGYRGSVSIVRPSAAERKNRQEYSLHAADNSAIVIFGERLLQLHLGLRRSFLWVFTLADTRYSILGVDCVRHFNLIVSCMPQHSLVFSVNHPPF